MFGNHILYRILYRLTLIFHWMRCEWSSSKDHISSNNKYRIQNMLTMACCLLCGELMGPGPRP